MSLDVSCLLHVNLKWIGKQIIYNLYLFTFLREIVTTFDFDKTVTYYRWI